MAATPPTTTVRIPLDLKKKLDETLGGRSMNSLIIDLLRKHIQHGETKPKISPADYKKLIVESVADALRKNSDWIQALLDPAILEGEGESIFAARSGQFEEEKASALSGGFIPWLVHRILQKIDEGYDVFLVIDSGTTLHSTFPSLQEQIVSLAKSCDKLEHLAILTNNMAIVKAYTSSSTHVKFVPYGGNKPIGISDYVYCYVLGGRLFSLYAALTGTETAAALQEARKSPPLVRAADNAGETDGKRERPALFIGLLVGEWVRISESSRLRHPIPLARGYGQKRFKASLIKACDEVFLLTPLGKLFLSTASEIREGLGSEVDWRGRKRTYEDVPIEKDQEAKIKLVTTYRPSEEKSVLGVHSSKIRAIYPPGETAAYDPAVTDFSGVKDGKELPGFFFAFDELADRTPEAQRAIEFPNVKEGSDDPIERLEAEKTKPFMMRAFSVPSHMQR